MENKNTLNEERLKVHLTLFSQEEIDKIPGVENIPEIDGKMQIIMPGESKPAVFLSFNQV